MKCPGIYKISHEVETSDVLIKGDSYHQIDFPTTIIRKKVSSLEGGQGYVGCYENISGNIVAIKHYNKFMPTMKYFNNAAKLLKMNIGDVANLPIYMDEEKGFMVFEAGIGDVFDFITSNQEHTRDDMINIMQQMTYCVLLFHENNIIHCDIKPENMIIFNRSSDGIQIELGDLDSCVINKDITKHPYTPFYTPPEDTISDKTDIYALAMSIIVLLTKSMNVDFKVLFKELSKLFCEDSVLVHNDVKYHCKKK